VNYGLLTTPQKVMDFVLIYIEKVFNLIKERGFLSSREIAHQLKIHQNTALKRLQWLQKNELIKKEGSGTKVKYGI
jgi:Mn-dependent DtxR family transcriptional regulator